MTTEREMLIDALVMSPMSGTDLTRITRTADAILASDWLTAHTATAVDAAVEAAAVRVEALESFAHGQNETSKSFLIGYGTAKKAAARAVRGDS